MVLGAVAGAVIVVALGASGGQALAAVQGGPAAAPLSGSASGTLSQLSATQWTTTVYLDTAALCAGSRPAGNHFSLVTGKPASVTGAAAPAYPDGPLACGAAAANPVTQVKLTFTPSLSAVPQAATLIVTPPQALLAAGDPPAQIPLTVRRTVSPWQYVAIPAICGGALAALLVLLLMIIGMPRWRAGQAAGPAAAAAVVAAVPPSPPVPAGRSGPSAQPGASDPSGAPGQPGAPSQPEAPGTSGAPVRPLPPAPSVPPAHSGALRQPGPVPEVARPDFGTLLLMLMMTKRRELLVTELPMAAESDGPAALSLAARSQPGTVTAGKAPEAATAGAYPAASAYPAAGVQPAVGPRSAAGASPLPGTQPAAGAHPAVGAQPAPGAHPAPGAQPAVPPPPAAGGYDAAHVHLAASPDTSSKRVHGGLRFWRTPLFAGTAWSFGDSWATSVTPLTALAGGVLAASGAVAGLVPGVDLTRFGLLMALVGGLTTLAPLLFGVVNTLFPARDAGGAPVPAGEVVAARLWVMLLASCLTVFAIGAEIGFVGLVLGFELLVVSPDIRWIGPALTGLAAVLFLAYGAHSILTLTSQPSGAPKKTAFKSSFLM